MPWRPRTHAAALGATVVAIALGGCGSDEEKTIPPSASDQLLASLDRIRDQIQDGDCAVVPNEAASFQSTVDQVSNEIDAETRDELSQLADNLVELARDPSQCAEGATGETGVTETEPTTMETTEPTTTDTTDETTTEEEQPTKPEPTEPEPTEPEPEPEPQGGSQGTGGGGTEGSGTEGSGASSGGIGVKPRDGRRGP